MHSVNVDSNCCAMYSKSSMMRDSTMSMLLVDSISPKTNKTKNKRQKQKENGGFEMQEASVSEHDSKL
jgi:hypothetical protein